LKVVWLEREGLCVVFVVLLAVRFFFLFKDGLVVLVMLSWCFFSPVVSEIPLLLALLVV
jgi:hypothetical protein